jgi:hypothetical protein
MASFPELRAPRRASAWARSDRARRARSRLLQRRTAPWPSPPSDRSRAPRGAAIDFNFDFGVSFTSEDIAAGRAIYNYGTVIKRSQDMFNASIFVKGDDGAIFHSYSTHHRGGELLMGAFNWLDLVPKGRNESAGVMNWVR